MEELTSQWTFTNQSFAMIPALLWVPRGAPRAHPLRFELSAEELERVQDMARGEIAEHLAERKEKQNEEAADLQGSTDDNVNDDGIEELDAGMQDEGKDDSEEARKQRLLEKLDLDNYDNDEEADDDSDDDEEGLDDDDVEGILAGTDFAQDEFEEMEILEEGGAALAVDDEAADEEDAEDNEIKPTDSVLLLATTEDEFSHLEVQILSEEGSLYTHHDILLPDFPLCLAWMDCPPYVGKDGQQLSVGNYVAVGTFQPAIEIWNLDVLDAIEPSAVLGGTEEAQKVKGKKKSKPRFKAGSHESSVLSLSWNTTYRQALASGSADNTVKIWDVTTQACSHTFTQHQDKVQSVLWHPTEAWLLATGSFDRSVTLIDCRSAAIATAHKTLPADLESLAWDPSQPYHLYASLEDGQVFCFDVRRSASNNYQELFSFQAHEKTVSNIQFCPLVRGLMATASIDKTVKLWDTLHAGAGQPPRCVAYKTMNVGKLFALHFNRDVPFLLATAGDKGMAAIWESDEMEVIKNHFEQRVLKNNSPYLTKENIDGEEPLPAEHATSTFNISFSRQESEAEDTAWMDDNAGIEQNDQKNNSNTNKKKKKKTNKK